MNNEILKFCSNKGFLLDKDLLNLFSELGDIESVKIIIEQITNQTSQRIITKNILNENKEKVNQIFLNIPDKNQKTIEKLKIKLGLSIEIFKEKQINHSFNNSVKKNEKKDEISEEIIEKKLTEKNKNPISEIKRVSRPGRRVYVASKDVPRALNGYGLTIVSTSSGVLTDKQAREKGVGGEVIGQVW